MKEEMPESNSSYSHTPSEYRRSLFDANGQKNPVFKVSKKTTTGSKTRHYVWVKNSIQLKLRR